ncbi:hypothetical protein BV22DRAFT_1051964 [Leucogyrophana mollusca]|uniref:Uncharacterized protein n=1 Tax=Leucogyrophana mollusca TaxID=85980 RepID=A0ACB8AXH2_9AGAM|nr:hypothetical protein BV22DRAFT_1051964 [Leucogyrophana mollusca]
MCSFTDAKKEKNEHSKNTSGESKASVYKRVGAVILPEFHAINPTATGDQIKGKIESPTKTYKRHAAKLRTTGGGLRKDGNDDNCSDDEFCDFYIGADGPDDNTPNDAKNIWEKIKRDFVFFLELHRIFAARPNVTPIAVTTGIGPDGKKTLHMQPPSDDEDFPVLTSSQIGQIRTLQDALNLAQMTHRGSSPSLEVDDDKENATLLTASTPTPSQKKAPKPLSLSQDSILKAKGRIQKIPQKRTIDDTLFKIQKANLDALNNRACEEMNLKKRALLLD